MSKKPPNDDLTLLKSRIKLRWRTNFQNNQEKGKKLRAAVKAHDF